MGPCAGALELEGADSLGLFTETQIAKAQDSKPQLREPQKRDTIQNRYKMPREVELKVKELLAAKGMKQAELAKRVGVSKGTVAGYHDNSWTVLDRTVLERMADVFQCEAGSLLVTQDSSFFHSYRSHEICTYLRRPDAETVEAGRPLGFRDIKAANRVDELLKNCVEGIVDREDSASTPETFGQRIRNNCVVLGSPTVNPASEMAICFAFGVEPFQPGVSGRLPFHFQRAVHPGKQPLSSLSRTSPDGKVGIWLRDEKELLEADILPPEEFRRKEIKKGRDCAVVVVTNHQPDEEVGPRKLVVLSGYAGVGTEAAAKALVDDYRDLEPRGSERAVWGAIEVLYKKDPDSTRREILSYKWRYRQGGRCPVVFTFKKP